jgi:UDP-N-acetylglucosamine enolpyruvyl transferase
MLEATDGLVGVAIMRISFCLFPGMPRKMLLRNIPHDPEIDTLAQILGELGYRLTHKDITLILELVDGHMSEIRLSLLEKVPFGLCILGPLLMQRKKVMISIDSDTTDFLDRYIMPLTESGVDVEVEGPAVALSMQHA